MGAHELGKLIRQILQDRQKTLPNRNLYRLDHACKNFHCAFGIIHALFGRLQCVGLPHLELQCLKLRDSAFHHRINRFLTNTQFTRCGRCVGVDHGSGLGQSHRGPHRVRSKNGGQRLAALLLREARERLVEHGTNLRHALEVALGVVKGVAALHEGGLQRGDFGVQFRRSFSVFFTGRVQLRQLRFVFGDLLLRLLELA